jgi:putative heme-binding domain-containing protein
MLTRQIVCLGCVLLGFAGGAVWGQSDPGKPFPQNRVVDFYSRQAAEFLRGNRAIPGDVLAQFPGLDGGGFGHWGQNPEDVSFDRSLNEADLGNVVMQLTHHFGRTTAKAVNVLVDADQKQTVMFDPLKQTFVESWQGQFVSWGFVRFGLMDGVRAGGEMFWPMTTVGWKFPGKASLVYRGFHRHGEAVVFESALGGVRLLDHCGAEGGRLVRTLQVSGGRLPAGTWLGLVDVPDVSTARVDRSDTGLHVLRIVHGDRVLRIGLAGTSADGRRTELEVRGGMAGLVFGGIDNEVIRMQLEVIPADQSRTPVDVAKVSFPKAAGLSAGGAAQWLDRPAVTRAVPGTPQNGIAIDTLTLPHFEQNPFRTAMRIGGVGALSGGRVAVATLMGEVWVVSGTDGVSAGGELRWQRVASGLYRALGLVVQNDQLLVLGSDQVTRLHDFNGDGEADFYECLTNGYPTTGGHDFCTSLQQDSRGELYWSVSSQDFGVAHRNSAGVIRRLGSGLRNSNGIGVSADGRVVLCTVQEGTWTPASAIFEVSEGSYHGLKGPNAKHGRYGYDLPLCFLPRGVDNSSGEMRFLPEDERLGALSGAILGTSFGACQAYVVLRDELSGESGSPQAAQGAIVPLPGDYLSGVCRVAYSGEDGGIYLGGTEGWQSYAAEDGCLQRLRVVSGGSGGLALARGFEAWNNGVVVRFSEELDAESVTAANVFCQQWNYLYSAGYGSPEYSVVQPGRQGHDYVPVKSVRLLGDGRSVFVEIPQLHPVMQFHFHGRFRTRSGGGVLPDVFATIVAQRGDFTEYAGYAAVAKRAAPEFPVAERYEQDPRLVAQEQYGTNFGWVSSSQKLSISAAPGLQFEPRVLRVLPGARVSLAFRNGDPGMPHNVAIVKADAIDEFGERSMLLASNPRAIATHYVPEDPRELCFSPILQPGDSYTMYFEAPREPGEYRMVCTYPGHWRVMQGSLFVLPEGATIPESAFVPVRSFVRTWQTGDLAEESERLSGRSFAQGRAVFESAGCAKCHRMGEGAVVPGPELTKVSERYRGRRLLQQIIEPSAEVHPQYQTWVAVLTDGRALSGLKVAEGDESVTLLPNPLRPDQKVQIPRSELEELEASKTSTMPMNLLITYTRDEILDLLAYVQSGGRAEGVEFQPVK